MKFLSSLANLVSGRAGAESAATVTDLELAIVKLDPPDGSTLDAGKDVTITVEWRYSKPAGGIGVWVKPETPDDVGGGYEADLGETHAAGRGELVRTVNLNGASRLEALLLVARDARSREIFHRRIPVNYTYVASAEQEALERDGLGSRITSVAFDPPSPARLAPNTRVMVRIGYHAQSVHGLRPVAMPITELAMTYNGAVESVEGDGKLTQHFTVGEAGTVTQVRVALWNKGGATVDERLVDVDLRYER